MEIAFSLIVLLVVGAVGYFISKNQVGAAQAMMGGPAAIDDSNRLLFEATGYEHAACQGQPMEAQLEYSRERTKDPMAGVHLIRDAQGLTLHFKTSVTMAAMGVQYAAQWFGECRPSFGLHLIDAKLLGAEGRKAARAQGYERDLQPAYDSEVAISIPVLASRFKLFTTDPARALAWLQQPDVQQRLGALHSVDLLVQAERITLNDPMMDNLRAGGSTAQMLAQTPQQRGEYMVTVHQNVAGLLHSAAGATG